MADYKFKRAEEDSPTRCLGSTPSGSCPFEAMPGSEYCPRHGGTHAKRAEQKEQIRLYAVAKWQEKIGQQADHPKLKTLNEEIGITRIMIQERLQLCKDGNELVLASQSVAAMLTGLQTLIKTQHAIEKDRGILMDMARAKKLALDIVGILTTYIDDTAILEAITEDITNLFATIDESQ